MTDSGALTLEEHCACIGSYMQGCALLPFPRLASPLRSELATALRSCGAAAVATWIASVAEAFDISDAETGEVSQWMQDALLRWCRHIEDPADAETYVFLYEHARRGFISQFPASRFLSFQMRFYALLVEQLRLAYPEDTPHRQNLLALFRQEFQERILYITDFFVAGREQQLREHEASYRQASDNAPAAIFHVDAKAGHILGASKVAEQTVGYGRTELATMSVWELIPSDERERAIRLLEETRRRGSSNREELHLRRRDGALVPVFATAGLIEYGHHQYFQIVCIDISDRKRLESQLIQSEKMAAIGQLAAGIAHEIRNPLGIITNALYDLDSIIASDDPAVQDDLRIAKEEMARVQDIINNLLEFSHESRAELQAVDINDLLRRTLLLMNKSLQNSDVRVVTEFGALGPCMANQNALRQIFLNLITNAVHAMPNGGELRLRTGLLLDGRIQLEFSDTGMGIPPEHLKDVFNPFFTTKAPGQGTGLGLSVVHSVVMRYHGEIRVESEVNRGTTFIIEFPCVCGDVSNAAATV